MRVRAATSVLFAGVVAASLAGCTFVTPIATQYQYAPSDGVIGTVGEIELLNVLVLTDDGENGNLLFAADNPLSESVDLGIQYVSEGGERIDLVVEIPPSSFESFGFGDGGQLHLPEIGAIPGGLLGVYFQYGDESGVELDVPVLDGSLEQYEPFLPTPPPTPEPTGSVEPVESATPEPEATPEG